MNKLIIGAALAAMMSATSAHVVNHDVCGDSTWTERTLYMGADKVGQTDRLDYRIVDGMKCVSVPRGHTHQILWDDGTITLN